MLEVKNLTKTFKNEKYPLFHGLSFNVKDGEKLMLTGSDGAGKTTLLRLISGLLLPDNLCPSKKNAISPILLNGFSPYYDLAQTKNIIGYMPQKFALYEDLTVGENIEFYNKLKHENQNTKSDEILQLTGLFEFKKRLAGALSGGMKQKLGLSCALLSAPKILLLDEPTVGVDPISRKELIKITEKLSYENKISVIWATSYLDEAEHFDRVLFLDKGKKVYEGEVGTAKKAMNGLVFYTNRQDLSKREYLNFLINGAFDITDATIEGENIRIIFNNKESAEKFPYYKEKATPVFEDFAMSILKKKKFILPQGAKDVNVNQQYDFAVEAKNLTKKYGNFTAADNITFNVNKGEIFGLLGPNGAGKSTTFKMLCSLIKPTYGYSKIFGLNILENPIEAKKKFGYMAQKFSLFGNLSVRQNIEFFMGMYGVEKQLNDVIKGYDIEKYLDYNASSVPLGYKQRLSLLCALVHNPSLLFLDEPTSGTDPISRREFWIRINNLAHHGTSVIVTTHFMDEAQFCDKIALIDKGKILVTDTPDNLKNSVKSANLKNPTMEDAFIEIVKMRAQK